MTPQIIIALVMAAGSFVGGWTVKSWQVGYKEKARVEQVLEQQRTNAAAALRRHDTVQEAQAAAIVRENQLRADSASARNQLNGMRDTLSRTLRDAATSQSACADRALALGELLITVEEAGAGLAEKAGRHANDVATCHAGWIK